PQNGWKHARFRRQLESVGTDAFEGGGDGGVVSRRGGKRFLRETPFRSEREAAAGAPQFIGDWTVIRRGRNDRDVMKILGCGADHRRATDIDVFDQFLKN